MSYSMTKSSSIFKENCEFMPIYKKTLDPREKELLRIIYKSEFIREILDRAHELNLPQWHLGAGCIAQTVWNSMHGYDLMTNIKDFDFVYYDPDLSGDKEQLMSEQVKTLFAHLPVELDVVNEARVHLWYEEYFGHSINPYKSSADAISTWPTTATSVGITCSSDKVISIEAPYGLEDLLSMVVRANKKQITEEIYLKKVERWTRVWPRLTVVPWHTK